MASDRKTVKLLYGRTGMELRVPASAAVLTGRPVACDGRYALHVQEFRRFPRLRTHVGTAKGTTT